MSLDQHPYAHPARPSGALPAWKPRPLSSHLPHTPPEAPARHDRAKTLLFAPSVPPDLIHPAETHVIHRALHAMGYHVLAQNRFLPGHHPLHTIWPQIRAWRTEVKCGDHTASPAEFIRKHFESAGDPADPFSRLPLRVDTIHIMLKVRQFRDPDASAPQDPPATTKDLAVPSDICIPIRNLNQWNALEDTPPILTRNAAISADELAGILEHTLFDTDHKPEHGKRVPGLQGRPRLRNRAGELPHLRPPRRHAHRPRRQRSRAADHRRARRTVHRLGHPAGTRPPDHLGPTRDRTAAIRGRTSGAAARGLITVPAPPRQPKPSAPHPATRQEPCLPTESCPRASSGTRAPPTIPISRK